MQCLELVHSLVNQIWDLKLNNEKGWYGSALFYCYPTQLFNSKPHIRKIKPKAIVTIGAYGYRLIWYFVGQGNQVKSFSSLLIFFCLEDFGGNPSSFLLLASPIILFRSGQIIRVLWSDWSIKILFRDYFGVIEKGITERRQEEMLQGMMEKLQALEGGRVLDI